MNKDALIDEVRDARHEISEECGHDLRKLQKLCQALEQELAATGRHTIVTQEPGVSSRNTATTAAGKR